MQTVTISMRLPKSEAGRMERVARELGMERPTFLKQALKRGAADLEFENACRAYRGGKATLSRAAEMAGLTLRDMILGMRDADLELNYSVADLQKDLQP